MNKKLIVAILSATIFTPNLCSAENLYGVIGYGILDSENADMGNISLTLGNSINDVFSIEAAFTFTINKEELGDGDNLSSSTIGMFAVYQSKGDAYFKGRVGYSKIDFDLEVLGITFTDDTDGLAYGIGFGFKSGVNAIEFEYTILPDLDSFIGIQADASNDYVGVGYKVSF